MTILFQHSISAGHLYISKRALLISLSPWTCLFSPSILSNFALLFLKISQTRIIQCCSIFLVYCVCKDLATCHWKDSCCLTWTIFKFVCPHLLWMCFCIMYKTHFLKVRRAHILSFLSALVFQLWPVLPFNWNDSSLCIEGWFSVTCLGSLSWGCSFYFSKLLVLSFLFSCPVFKNWVPFKHSTLGLFHWHSCFVEQQRHAF